MSHNEVQFGPAEKTQAAHMTLWCSLGIEVLYSSATLKMSRCKGIYSGMGLDMGMYSGMGLGNDIGMDMSINLGIDIDMGMDTGTGIGMATDIGTFMVTDSGRDLGLGIDRGSTWTGAQTQAWTG